KPFAINRLLNIFTLNLSYGDYLYTIAESAADYSYNGFEDGISKNVRGNPTPKSGGDDGSDYYIRKYFADNPEFKTVILDENGEGILTFTVPDNLTAWRATVSVISGADGELKDIKAGSATSEVLCTQPYFISINACDTYVSGDDAAFGVRSYGNGASGTVSYSATLTDENGSVIGTQSAESEPLVQAQFNFGKLATGHYVLTVKGSCGEYKDAMEKGFDVTAGSAVNTVTTDISISEITSLKPALYPVQLMFYDSDAMKGYFGYYYGRTVNRADCIAARYEMVKAYAKVNGADNSEEAEELAKQFEQYKDVSAGYVKLLTYGSTDIELTSLIMTLAPDLFTAAEKQKMIEGYYSSISSKNALDDQTLCAMLLGLASAGEPVLDQLYEVSAGADDYSVEAKLYLAAAFASIGDYGASKTILETLIKEYGVYYKEYDKLYFKADNTYDRIRRSALAIFSAAMISKERAVSLLNSLERTYSKTESWDLAKAMYVKFFAPNGEYEEKKATLNISGTDVDVTVKGYRRAYVTLSKSDLESFKIVKADEGISVRATYTAPIEVSEEVSKESGRIKVEKSITHFKGDIYEVTLRISGTSTRKCEYFTISDTIPSGARYFNSIETGYKEKRTSSLITWGGIYNTTTQKMRGSVSIYNRKAPNDSMDCEKYSFETSVSYYVRGALDGNFVVESAMVRISGTDYYAKSDRMSLTISNRKEWTLQELDIA
ncbi:MAG: hypothetical protein IJS94_09250, partial [Clostridia bacterium]|nr:hypothetical protein [Clostridia bacterium]